jgi:hypothetical protein
VQIKKVAILIASLLVLSFTLNSCKKCSKEDDESSSGDNNKTTKTITGSTLIISSDTDDEEGAGGSKTTDDGLPKPPTPGKKSPKAPEGGVGGGGSGDGNVGKDKNGQDSKGSSNKGADWAAMLPEQFASNYRTIMVRKGNAEQAVLREAKKANQAAFGASKLFDDLAGKVKDLVKNAKSGDGNDIRREIGERGNNMESFVIWVQEEVYGNARNALNDVVKEEKNRAQVAREAVDSGVLDVAVKQQLEDENFTREMPVSDEVLEAAMRVTVAEVNTTIYRDVMYKMWRMVVAAMADDFKRSGRRDSDNDIVVKSAYSFAYAMRCKDFKDKYTRNHLPERVRGMFEYFVMSDENFGHKYTGELFPKQVEEVYGKLCRVADEILQLALNRPKADA